MTALSAAPDRLRDLVGFLALRFTQLRPTDDPSAVAVQLIAEYAFEHSPVFAQLQGLDERYTEEFAATLIDNAYLCTDGILDGVLTCQRYAKEVADLGVFLCSSAGGSAAGDRCLAIIQNHEITKSIQRRIDTLAAGISLCDVHLQLIKLLNGHSRDALSTETTEHGRPMAPMAPPWREANTALIKEHVDKCITAFAALDAAPAWEVVWRSRTINRIGRDVEVVRRALPLISLLGGLGPDPSLTPVSPIWQTLLELPEFEYEHQRVAAIRARGAHKMGLMRVVDLINASPAAQLMIVEAAERKAAAEVEAQRAAEAERKKREEEDRQQQSPTAPVTSPTAGATRRGHRS